MQNVNEKNIKVIRKQQEHIIEIKKTEVRVCTKRKYENMLRDKIYASN